MPFDPTKYNVKTEKPLPVILLLDVSSSMQGDKIESLHGAALSMVDTFVDEAIREVEINIAIITFGSTVSLHTGYMPVKKLKESGIEEFTASGLTPLGTALRLAKDLIEDKSIIPSKAYRPAVILVSDGEPNDEWQSPLKTFINDGRSSKCQRFAVAIGQEADRLMLEQFAGCPENVFFAENAADIAGSFKQITMSVSVRSKSRNPNEVSISEPKSNVQNEIEPVYNYNIQNDDDDELW